MNPRRLLDQPKSQTIRHTQCVRPPTDKRTCTVPLWQDVKLPKDNGNAEHACSVPYGQCSFQKGHPKGPNQSLNYLKWSTSTFTRETMPMQLHNQEMTLVLTDVSPYMIGSIIITKGKPVTAYCQNLTSQPRHTTTKNELRSIITKLRAQPDVLAEHTIQVCTDNRSVRYGYFNTISVRPWQLILNGSTVTLTYLPLSVPVTADEVSRQERHPLLLDPHSTA
jgi:hypothetical protein